MNALPKSNAALPLRAETSARYLVVSGLSFGLNVGLTAALHEGLGVPPEVAFAVALAAVFVVNFAAMRWWIFAGTTRPLVPQLAGFAAASLAFRGFEYAAWWALYRGLGVPYLAAVVCAIGVSFVAKYLLYDSWLFARSRA